MPVKIIWFVFAVFSIRFLAVVFVRATLPLPQYLLIGSLLALLACRCGRDVIVPVSYLNPLDSSAIEEARRSFSI